MKRTLAALAPGSAASQSTRGRAAAPVSSSTRNAGEPRTICSKAAALPSRARLAAELRAMAAAKSQLRSASSCACTCVAAPLPSSATSVAALAAAAALASAASLISSEEGGGAPGARATCFEGSSAPSRVAKASSSLSQTHLVKG